MSRRQKVSLIAAALILAAAVWQFYQPFGQSPESQVGAVNSTVKAAASSTLRLLFFDVGQGDAALIITPAGQTILVDGGPDNAVVEKLGRYLPPTVREIDEVILTHPHSDHVAGLVEVLKRYAVKRVVMTGITHTTDDYLEFLRLIRDKKITAQLIDRPQEELIGGVVLQYLEPAESFLTARPDNLNNSSIVFRLVYGSSSAMFTGDFEQEELLASSSAPLKSDLLKVGHHGSTNANSQNFLRAVAPAYAIISVGADNTYGHPHYRTIYYLEQLGAKIFRTDQSGDIEFDSDGAAFLPVSHSSLLPVSR